ncbi:MAG: cytochrome c oxidase subunit 3 family protein [Bacteroidota bacterium]
MEKTHQAHHEHYDPEASKIGMWLFIFTELLLFGAMFIIYSVYRYLNPEAFHLAGEELNTLIGAINTVILLVSSMTIAMSTSAIRKGNIWLTQQLLAITLVLALVFLVNKYFEWGSKFSHGVFPGSEYMLANYSQGEILFFGLYFVMTGLHAVHILVGMGLIIWTMIEVRQKKIHQEKYDLLENSGLYWHLVDIIWIFLFPLFYLIH